MPAKRLRLLHVIHDFLPRHVAGSEIYAFELTRELARRHHHVHVLCAEYDPARAHGHVTWRLHDGIPIVEIVNNWACGSFEETYRPPVIGEQIAHVLKAVQPDIVHVHSLLNLSFDLPRLARERGIAVVATLHDYSLVCPSGGQRIHRAEQHVCDVIDPERCARCFPQSPFGAQVALGKVSAAAPARLKRWAAPVARRHATMVARVASAASRVTRPPVSADDIVNRLSAARALFADVDVVVAPSTSMAREFERLGLDAGKIRLSDYGFAPVEPARPDRSGSECLRIGYVGTIVWHKGIHILIDAVGQLPPDRYVLRVFGNLETFADYAAQLRTAAAGRNVQFMGPFEHQRVAEVFAQMDVLVVPSLWLENSPLVIHEAFLAGVPVIGARIGGIADLVTDGENGFLYQPTSSRELASALTMLIERPERLAEFRRRLPAVKSIATNASEWEDIYSEVLQRRRATSVRAPAQVGVSAGHPNAHTTRVGDLATPTRLDG